MYYALLVRTTVGGDASFTTIITNVFRVYAEPYSCHKLFTYYYCTFAVILQRAVRVDIAYSAEGITKKKKKKKEKVLREAKKK